MNAVENMLMTAAGLRKTADVTPSVAPGEAGQQESSSGEEDAYRGPARVPGYALEISPSSHK